ncbi:hypothetical protein D3C87_1755910 [compost metagenome]
MTTNFTPGLAFANSTPQRSIKGKRKRVPVMLMVPSNFFLSSFTLSKPVEEIKATAANAKKAVLTELNVVNFIIL